LPQPPSPTPYRLTAYTRHSPCTGPWPTDWNPSGLLILQTYRSGSKSAALEASRYALEIHWLGIRSRDLNHVSDAAKLPLTELDRAKIRNLLAAVGASVDDVFESGSGGGGGSGGSGSGGGAGSDDGGGGWVHDDAAMMRRRLRMHVSELKEMYSTGMKAEIESMYPVDGMLGFSLSEFIRGKILHADYF